MVPFYNIFVIDYRIWILYRIRQDNNVFKDKIFILRITQTRRSYILKKKSYEFLYDVVLDLKGLNRGMSL